VKTIYLDHAAATPLDPRVKRAMDRVACAYGNPSSVHRIGRDAKAFLDASHRDIGKSVGARSEEITLTGSGTESDNLAIFGIARAYADVGRHIITTNIEHHAVLRACQRLERDGFEVTYVGVKPNGIVDSDDIMKAIRPDTILVSVIYANNEIGTIQPIKEISKALKLYSSKAVKFHTDACQAVGYLDINVQNLGVDLMTINGSKIYGPKGTGALFVRRGTKIAPTILGGDQERGLRAGTENAALFSGFAVALKIADAKKKESKRLSVLRDHLIRRITTEISGAHLNGDPIRRLPNNINISLDNIDGEILMLALDLKGIEVSTGSACTVMSNEQSHVLQALQKAPQPYSSTAIKLEGNIRITLGRGTTKKDLDYTVEILKKEVTRLRNL